MNLKLIYSSLVFFCLYLCSITAAQAGAFQVRPTKVILNDEQPIQTLLIRNLSATDLILSSHLVSWEQKNSKNLYQSSNELIITPPIVTIKAKSNQILRIGRTQAPTTTNETAYRLYIEEVVPEKEKKNHPFNMLLRVGLPVFSQGKAAVEPKNPLDWTLEKFADGIKITAINHGHQHHIIRELELNQNSKKSMLLKDKLATYILAGASHSFWIDNNKLKNLGIKQNTNIKLSARFDSQPSQVVIT